MTEANRQCGRNHEVTQTHKEAANLQMNQSDMKEAVKTAILQDDHVLLNLTSKRGFSLRTQILTAQRHGMGDSLLADDLLQRPIVA